jgi:hypothetical protein
LTTKTRVYDGFTIGTKCLVWKGGESNVQYNLENLHWREFERLAAFYLKEKVGEGLSVFGGSRDSGRDATFHGTANEFPSKSRPYAGDWIFQVKHRTTRGATTRKVERELLRSLQKELHKVFERHGFCCDNYVYITNINASNQFRDEATEVFTAFCNQRDLRGITFSVIEYKDLEIFLSKSPSTRYRFPSLLTYTDLEKVFLEKEETKNKGYLKFAYDNITRFVSTDHYLEAVHRIRNNNFLMLVGNPKSGKTSIVDAISLCFLEEGAYKPYFIRNTDEFFTITSYVPASEGAIFICDDIFGKHELDQIRLRDWTDYFQSVMGLIAPNNKFVFTTRQYIYEEFANKSGLRAFFPDEDDPTRYVIKLSKLSKEEREQILEKHLAFSDLSTEVIELALQMRQEILTCEDFSPEVIRSLVSLLAKTEVAEVPQVIARHIAHPNQYLYDFFNNIRAEKRLLLLALAVSPSSEVIDVESAYLTLLGDSDHQPSVVFHTFISEIDGSIVKRRQYLDSCEIEYYHPSMHDVIIGICKRDKYHRRLVLRNANLDLFGLITLRRIDEDETPRIRLFVDECADLCEGVHRFLSKQEMLTSVTRLVRWISLFATSEIPYDLSFLKPFKRLQKDTSSRLAQVEFFDHYADEPVRRWIGLLDNWRPIAGAVKVQYWDGLEAHHRDYVSFDYWRLVFLIESISSTFIERTIKHSNLNEFTQLLSERVVELKTGINLVKGRPKTHERWLPLFREIDDLIMKMKGSQIGRRIIDDHLLNDWQDVKMYSEFCKNRHRGMIKAGHWKPYEQLRGFTSLRESLTPSLLGVPICPSCGALMVIRTAKRGPCEGQQFYGCSNYPKCRQTLPLQPEKG